MTRFLSMRIACMLMIAFAVSTANAQRLHVITFHDNNQDARFSNLCKIDCETFVGPLYTQIPESQLNIVPTRPATSREILNGIRALRIGQRDAVMFYFSGHGAFLADGDHIIQSRNEDIRRSIIVNAILERDPRLCILVTDCCSNVLEQQTPRTAMAAEAYSKARITRPSPLAQSLFFSEEGLVDITSAQKGQVSILTTSGSIFTKEFAAHMKKHSNDRLSWKQLYRSVRGSADAQFQQKYPGGYDKGGSDLQFAQTAFAFSLPGISFGAAVIDNGNNQGVRIEGFLEDSPAHQSRLKIGDVITSINGRRISNERDYANFFDDLRRTELSVGTSGGGTIEVDLTK